ncbi:hypothetical protein ANT2_4609 [plant metagenome]|uniref:Uncharacterized protein n=1 Tax=plant metagenome TaxID=1297885 RepID=A0A484VEX8_9ZZZZ
MELPRGNDHSQGGTGAGCWLPVHRQACGGTPFTALALADLAH